MMCWAKLKITHQCFPTLSQGQSALQVFAPALFQHTSNYRPHILWHLNWIIAYARIEPEQKPAGQAGLEVWVSKQCGIAPVIILIPHTFSSLQLYARIFQWDPETKSMVWTQRIKENEHLLSSSVILCRAAWVIVQTVARYWTVPLN